jgi:hypothetical protein
VRAARAKGELVHPLFNITDKLPLPAGQSPFHVRGFYYARRLMRVETLPGGIERLRQQLRDESVREFVMQPFAWTRWYDALPTMPIYAALARMEGVDFESAVREGTRKSAHALVPGADSLSSLFRMAERFTRPGLLASRVTQIVLGLVDFTRITLDPFELGRGSGVGSGIPLIIAPNVGNLVLGWFQGMLEVAGAKDINARYADVVIDGERNGFPTVSMRYEFSWSPEVVRMPSQRPSARPSTRP